MPEGIFGSCLIGKLPSFSLLANFAVCRRASSPRICEEERLLDGWVGLGESDSCTGLGKRRFEIGYWFA